MCGIIISTLEIPEEAHNYVKNRGPDSTTKITYNNINFVHFLLHLTGSKTEQPVIEDNVICIFNGEIYNYKSLFPEAKSDIYSIIYCYKKYGEDFVKYLDGEFVIILFDFKENKLIITSDIFKTKPLFYNINNEIVISSYESSCKKIKEDNYNKLNANEMLVFSLNKENGKRKLIKKKKIHEFDLTQKKDNYNDYIKAFENAVLKRYPEYDYPLVTLSGGLDSGSIACCLNKYKKKALYVSITKNEDIDTIRKRKKLLGNNHIIINNIDNKKKKWKNILNKTCEHFVLDWSENKVMAKTKKPEQLVSSGFDAGAYLAKSEIIDISKKLNSKVKILFSGIGADEIMGRNQWYGKGWGNVDEFPQNLNTVYPWGNFFGNTMENYLKGDEYIGGCFSYETRYPFCDKELVQEFLWLKPELKNTYKDSIYKPPLLYYLEKENFPMYYKKKGFNV